MNFPKQPQQKKNMIAYALLALAVIALLLSPTFLQQTLVSRPSVVYAADPVGQGTLTFAASNSAQGIFSGAGVSVQLPTNIQGGDLLIAVAGTNGQPASWSTPAGWTMGANSQTTNSQGLQWWWKIADGAESGTSVAFQSSQYADGGIVVNVYRGETADAIAGVSPMTTSNNFGNGFVTSAGVAGMTTAADVSGVPLLFASWQPNATTVTWPDGFAFESTATDGYSYVGVAEGLNPLTTMAFPGYTVSFSSGQAVVQTLQVIVKVK